ncbi:MAG: ABC transporter ATP-binding protein [Candidatus Pacebacteria bacterium]|nr:ABC transporter ATP-binding protein [Candidatus Paceibacterota bacterium]
MKGNKLKENLKDSRKPKGPSVFSVLGPYKKMVTFLIGFAILTNALNLFIPKIIARSIDAYIAGTLVVSSMVWQFSIAIILIFIFSYAQSIVQIFASEKVARDTRKNLSDKVSRLRYVDIEKIGPSKLLTTLTSDIDSIKMFVSMAIVSIVSSLVIIVGVTILLLSINWKLALVVLSIIPIIGLAFFFIFSKVQVLFVKTREVVDGLNKVINESILGAAIIRVVNAQANQYKKFLEVNTQARSVGLSILSLFAALIPIISFVAGLATLGIVMLGGKFVIAGSMSLGEFTAFYSYVAMLIFPIIIIGFMSSIIAQASASFGRIKGVLDTEEIAHTGVIKTDILGDIEFKNITQAFGEKKALDNVSFKLKAGTKTAIIGPTAAGKSQLLYILTGLVVPTSGNVFYDNKDIKEYEIESFHNQVSLVFQDSTMFNMSIRENIAFNSQATEESLNRAIQTAELSDFIKILPDGLDTVISERGTSLSGGQKQRIMLARALATNPKVLLLDDFTARVDTKTEKGILSNISKNYPGITLVSVTQKIATVEEYDSIIVLMEGELLAQGTHKELMESSTEYIQIYNSQQSTNTYEVRT